MSNKNKFRQIIDDIIKEKISEARSELYDIVDDILLDFERDINDDINELYMKETEESIEYTLKVESLNDHYKAKLLKEIYDNFTLEEIEKIFEWKQGKGIDYKKIKNRLSK